ncbi:MAG: SpoIID/LytB domain-containing protein [Bacteroidota bacterium]|nr:SpoIID/LytB domain-containing protein [Bacteroidota bacterium]
MIEPSVSVSIMSETEIEFELYGDFKCPASTKSLRGVCKATIENNWIVVKSGNDTVKTESEILFTPSDIESASFLLRDVTIGIQFHWQKKENQRFLGSLKLLVGNGKLTAVNVLPVEQYLMSVISSEMSATSSIELLKAHAIISRSWLLAQIEKDKNIRAEAVQYISTIENEDERIKWYDRQDHTLYDVCADDHCQRYQGITKLYAHNAQTAVAETHGLILFYNNKICDARFSKSCGGVTENFENVWEPIEHPYLKKIVDYKYETDDYSLELTNEKAAVKWILGSPPSYCNSSDKKIIRQVLLDYDQKTKDFYRWKVEYSQKEISSLITKKLQIVMGDILDLIPVQRGESARLVKLKIVGSKKTFTIGKELEIRRALSKTHLYSSAVYFEKMDIVDGIPQKFIIHGAGWGHGVGLCQIGAAVMGEMGYVFDEILLHYFKGATIKKIY